MVADHFWTLHNSDSRCLPEEALSILLINILRFTSSGALKIDLQENLSGKADGKYDRRELGGWTTVSGARNN